jgi:hypothetical protein
VHHSDRGLQFVSIKDTERLAEAGLVPSVGSVGDSYNNALAETINGLYKAEVIWRRGPWRSSEAVEPATLERVDWFINRRLLEPIGNIPPAEAEAAYYARSFCEEPMSLRLAELALVAPFISPPGMSTWSRPICDAERPLRAALPEHGVTGEPVWVR